MEHIVYGNHLGFISIYVLLLAVLVAYIVLHGYGEQILTEQIYHAAIQRQGKIQSMQQKLLIQVQKSQKADNQCFSYVYDSLERGSDTGVWLCAITMVDQDVGELTLHYQQRGH